MTTDLDTLRPEVREAINRQDRQEKCDEYCPVCEDRATIRAELLRLARNDADAHIALDCEHDWQVMRERAERAEADLAIAHRERDRMFLNAREWATRFGEMEARAEKAEAELLRLMDDCARLVDCINAQPPTRRSLIDRAERAYAELAALQARIAGSSVVKIANYGDPFIVLPDHLTVPNSLKGKTVRLLVEE